MQRTWMTIGAVVVLVALAGCGGVLGGDGGDGGGSTPDWCQEGELDMSQMNQGGQVDSVSVEGVVDRNGQDMCHIHYEFGGNGQMSMIATADLYFTENQNTYEYIMYDSNGNVVSEVSQSGDA